MRILCALSTIVAMSLLSTHSSQAEPLNVGDSVPAVKTVDADGKAVDLGKELSEGISLVYFYPKADTPGCTKQACNLRDAFEDVTGAGIKVFGVSADNSSDQKAFAEKFNLPFTLLADAEGKVIKAFGVPTNPRGFASRQSFLVKDNKVIWRDLKATPTSQAQDAITAAKANG
ncbi:MAG: peroxiredoxin [Verrucomicrobiales bacterium]|nr:peroxiredoxin [Verrucomicrobiales bacterium]